MENTLQNSKLHVPQIRPFLVPRPRLIAKLNDSLRTKLTLVFAPSGSGKTTLVASWLRPADAVTKKSSFFGPDASSYAWLTLDPLDNAPARFLTGLVGALQTVDPRLGKLLLAMVQLPELPPIPTLLGSVISDLGLWIARDYLPLTLVLDDYHHIESEFVQQALAFLLDNQPPQLHLVLLTNTAPPPALARLRLLGQLVELGEEDLRFDTAEAAQFLNDNLHLNLPGSVVEALALGVSGWAAGLQLAALAIERHADPRALVAALPADRLETSGFLLDEYLQQQAPEMQRFLLLTSILPYLCADLCDAVWRAGNQKSSFYPAAFMLDHLGTSNPFLAPLDAAGRWHAYHDLFAGLLRRRLERTGIDTAVLHRSAGEWLQANNLWEEAVPHFLAARAWDRAGELLVKLADCLQRRGEALTLRRWLEQMPAAQLQRQPALAVNYLWALILTGEPEKAETYLEPVIPLVQDAPALKGQALYAQAFISRSRYDVVSTIPLAREALACLPPEQATARSRLAVDLGISLWTTGRMDETIPVLIEARRASEEAANNYARLTAIGFLALAYGVKGQFRRAAGLLQQALLRMALT